MVSVPEHEDVDLSFLDDVGLLSYTLTLDLAFHPLCFGS